MRFIAQSVFLVACLISFQKVKAQSVFTGIGVRMYYHPVSQGNSVFVDSKSPGYQFALGYEFNAINRFTPFVGVQRTKFSFGSRVDYNQQLNGFSFIGNVTEIDFGFKYAVLAIENKLDVGLLANGALLINMERNRGGGGFYIPSTQLGFTEVTRSDKGFSPLLGAGIYGRINIGNRVFLLAQYCYNQGFVSMFKASCNYYENGQYISSDTYRIKGTNTSFEIKLGFRLKVLTNKSIEVN